MNKPAASKAAFPYHSYQHELAVRRSAYPALLPANKKGTPPPWAQWAYRRRERQAVRPFPGTGRRPPLPAPAVITARAA
jgi:hypothetical protein